MRTLIFLICLSSQAICFSQLKVGEVYNPIINNERVSNQDEVISEATKSEINTILNEIYVTDSFEVAFVILNSIGEQSDVDFANQLFKYWGIGSRKKDNGLLVLFVLDQRKIAFETGYGTEMIMSDATCKSIQQEYMVPDFKEGDYDLGLIKGANAIKEHLNGKVLDNKAYAEPNYLDEYARNEEKRLKDGPLFLILGILAWHLLGILIYFFVFILTKFENDPYLKYNKIKIFRFWIWAILFPLSHILILIWNKKLMDRYRNAIRFSAKNGAIMHKLNDEEEDRYLEKGQISEELVKSVDYDVWTTDLDDDLLILKYKKTFSGYHACPKCKFLTYMKDFDVTVVSPTYYSSGSGKRQHSCRNCNHVDLVHYTIPRLQKSSSSSSSYSGGSGWSGGGGSSGGGSWGGGSSGGGGASSSW